MSIKQNSVKLSPTYVARVCHVPSTVFIQPCGSLFVYTWYHSPMYACTVDSLEQHELPFPATSLYGELQNWKTEQYVVFIAVHALIRDEYASIHSFNNLISPYGTCLIMRLKCLCHLKRVNTAYQKEVITLLRIEESWFSDHNFFCIVCCRISLRISRKLININISCGLNVIRVNYCQFLYSLRLLRAISNLGF